jgi:hypothetical protein
MSSPAHDMPAQHASRPPGPGRRRRAVLAVLAAFFTLAAIGCASIVPTLMHRPQSRSPQQPGSGRAQPRVPRLAGAAGLVTPAPGIRARRPHPRRPAVTPGGPARLIGRAMFGGDGPLVGEEGRLGRTLAVVRVYDRIGESFSNPDVDRFMASGSTLVVSLDTTSRAISYASIADGREDGTISSFLRQMNRAAIAYHLNAIYFDFEHEADITATHGRYGTPAEFVRAWDHIHALATAAHLDWNQGGRLHWVLILTHYAYYPKRPGSAWPGASSFWPGNREVDIVGVDGYNTSSCRKATPGSDLVASGSAVQTPADLFDPTLSFARAHGNVPVFVTEWASVPYKSPSVQPGFIHQMEDFVTANHQIGAAMYWDAHGHGNGCDYIIDNRPASLAALTAMGHAAGLQAGALIRG